MLAEEVLRKHKEIKRIHNYISILFIRMKCFLETLQKIDDSTTMSQMSPAGTPLLFKMLLDGKLLTNYVIKLVVGV
jgi:hypothetical protein